MQKDEIFAKAKLRLKLMGIQDDTKGKGGSLQMHNACRMHVVNGIYNMIQAQAFVQSYLMWLKSSNERK